MNDSLSTLGLSGVESHDDPRAVRAWRWLQWMLFACSLLSIPAFYAELTNASPVSLKVGRLLYLGMFAGFAASFAWLLHLSRRRKRLLLRNRLDVLILCGSAASIAWGSYPWSSLEWALRMAFMCIVALRIVVALRRFFVPDRLLFLFAAGAAVLALAGAGFYWLEPQIHTYADGLWLAFESSATVGYGDFAPTTPASRVFAAFVVLLGYGMLSLVFASIAAMFVGQEEKALRREMHRDIKRLHEEIAALKKELQGQREAPGHAGTIATDIRREAHD